MNHGLNDGIEPANGNGNVNLIMLFHHIQYNKVSILMWMYRITNKANGARDSQNLVLENQTNHPLW